MKLRTVLMAGATGLVMVGAGLPALAMERPVEATAAQLPAGSRLIPTQTFELDNGLRVIFHIDRSDPVTAVVLAARVGSARETPGRTGFAHLFEHLFFLNSENLGPGGLDAMSARIGGSGANGSTSFDLTDYLQTVPNDALEKMIWAEADKLGFFINTVTEPVLEKEKQVVKNEKRQSVDNQPYGHTYGVILEAMYPADHPYSWPVIGSLADLDAATLDDVRDFYRRWYTPNNSTLVIAGDFDPDQARAWVERYFAEIPRGEEPPEVQPRPAGLAETRRLMHEDNFARLPRLTLSWPGVERGHADEAALDTLMILLTDGRDAPLTRLLVDEAKLTDAVSGYASAQQIAGMAQLTVTAFDGTDLDTVRARLDEGLARFERDGVDTAALERTKTQAEADFYGSLGSVLGKGSALARYDLHATTADADLAAIRAVTAEDVMRVYRTYIKDRPHVATSFVPRGQTELALDGSEVARVVVEPIVQGAEAAVDPNAAQPVVARTPSAIDRTVEPPSGPRPVVVPPQIWAGQLANGIEVSGIRNDEVPLVSFQLSVDGGQLFDDPARPGAANMLASLMNRGTARRTPAELENALKALGASVTVSSGEERFLISGTTLARNFDATIDIVEEMLLEPRWDESELALLRASITAQLAAQRSQPSQIAERVYDVVAYGDDHILSRNRLGTEASVADLAMDDLKAMLALWSPSNARFRVVGDVDQATTTAALDGLTTRWADRTVEVPAYPAPTPPERSQVFVYDVPGAAQSVLLFGTPSLTRAAEDYYPGVVMNYRLGGGGFASRLTQQLREGAGYTYGINSGFQSRRTLGDFALRSSVRSNVTLEAATLARDIVRDYGATFTDEDLAVTQSALSRSRARAFETAGAKLGVLEAIGDFGLPQDYLTAEAQVIDRMSLDQVRTLADRLIDTDRMIYVVVGDAASQEARLEALGYGSPVRVNDRIDAAGR